MGNLLAYFTSSISSEDKQTTGILEDFSSYLSPVIFDAKTGQHVKFHSVLLSFTFFSLLYIAVNLMILLVTIYTKLSKEMEVIWTQTIVHVIFSSIVSPFSIWYLYADSAFVNNISHTATDESSLLMCITIGFMVHEITTSLTTNWNLGSRNYSIVYQDLVMLSCCCLILHYDRAHVFGLIAMTMEGVYIFDSISWILAQFNLLRTFIWKLIQVITIHLCNYCTMLGVYCLWMSYQQFDSLLNCLPVPVLSLFFTSFIIEMFIVIPSWSIKLMEMLEYSGRNKAVQLSSDVYRLSSVSFINVQRKLTV